MLSQTTEYALRAMSMLAYSPHELTPTPSLAERTKVPANYLAKVLQLLAGAELIQGRRGVGGGYKLSRPAAQISLLDVVRAVTKIERIRTCPLGLANHGPNLCPLHRKTDEAIARIIETYENVTLQDLIDAPGQNMPLCDEKATTRLRVDPALRRR
ncbi:MAG: Rrf2 family transcriptional regulator [Phycisphaerales bacterium]|nr:Rrf2 family transcriptional regulator [Phycisphaerales bacterium]MCB9840282.1 Rrf2 family transcriptional regulator [Phycisphaeraceae bacterium]